MKEQQRDFLVELEDAKRFEPTDLEVAQFVKGLPAAEWLTTVDYALAAGISDATVRAYIEEGRLIARLEGNVYKIARARAIQFFKSQYNTRS